MNTGEDPGGQEPRRMTTAEIQETLSKLNDENLDGEDETLADGDKQQEDKVDDAPGASEEVDPEKIFQERFKADPIAMARSYTELEKMSGRQSNEVGEARKLLQEAGYTFGADGKPVKPTVQTPANVADQPDRKEVRPDGSYKGTDGLWYDKYGMLYVSDEDWENLRKADLATYTDARISYTEELGNRKRQWQSAERIAIDENMNAGKVAVETYLTSIPHMASIPKAKEALTKAEKIFREHMPPEQQKAPGAMELAYAIAIAEDLPSIINEVIEKARAEAAAGAVSDKKTVATSSGSGVSAPANAGNKPMLTKEQEAMRQLWNSRNRRQFTEKEWYNNLG